MTQKELKTIARGIGPVIRQLQQRIRELEQTSVKHCGIWQPGRTYDKNSVVTLKGSWWIANETTSARPGDPEDAARAWQLTVKKGAAT